MVLRKFLSAIVSLYFFMLSSSLFAQSEIQQVRFSHPDGEKKGRYALTGKVTHLDSNEPLSGVALHLNGFFEGTVTDKNGQYLVVLDSGRHRVAFRQLGKKGAIYQVDLYGNGVLDVKLGNMDFELETFTLLSEERDRNIRNPISGYTKMNIAEIRLVPTLMGEPDVINVIQSLPGVTSVGEGSSGINIRGGQADQNLIMMNDALVLSQGHALGFLSPFNGEVVQNFTLFKGNIPSFYGGRSASALNIEMKKGDLETQNKTVSLGTAVSKLTFDGPLVKGKTSLVTSFRRSNANYLLDLTKEPDIQNSRISFYDLYAGIYHRFNDKNNLDFNLLRTGNVFDFANEFGFNWQNTVGSLTSKNLLSEKLSLISMLAFGDLRNTYTQTAGLNPREIENGMTYYQGKISGIWATEVLEITAGGEGLRYLMKPEQSQELGERSGTPPQLVNKQNGLEFAGFVDVVWNPNPAFSLNTGLRRSFYRQFGPDSIFTYGEGRPISSINIIGSTFQEGCILAAYDGWEPRLSFRINIDSTNAIKGGYSRMFQYLQSISNTSGPTPIDLWQLSTRYIPPQASHNFTIGYFRDFKENEWSTSLEGFYRVTANQTEYRDFADLFLNPHLETELVQGTGLAYGAELLIRRNTGKITGWLAYTFSRSLIRTESPFSQIQINNGRWFPANFDRPHIVSLVSNFHISKSRSFNINGNFSSGRPVTGMNASFRVGNITVPNFRDRNEFRIPDYLRLDISYNTNGLVRKWDDKINFSIYNLLGRRNAYSVFFKQEAQVPRLVPYQLSILGSVFPSISYVVNFTQ
jgi:hypothetical protein